MGVYTLLSQLTWGGCKPDGDSLSHDGFFHLLNSANKRASQNVNPFLSDKLKFSL